MRKNVLMGLFVALAVVQIAVPVFMIRQQEGVLKGGQEFKFRTQPVDPFDAFRGRYVALSLKETQGVPETGAQFKPGQNVYAVIETDADGFSRFGVISSRVPRDLPYLKAKALYVFKEKITLRVPIDRYYMPEAKAPKAEELYRRHSSRRDPDAYVVVKVQKGIPVIKALYVGGKPIEQALEEPEEVSAPRVETVVMDQLPGASAIAVDPPASEQEIVSLYQTILGREPDAGGLQHWVQLSGNGMPLSEIVFHFFNSPEFRGFSLDRKCASLYRVLLGREPSADERNARMPSLNNGQPLSFVAGELCNSPEFQAKPEEFKQKVLQKMQVLRVLENTR